MDIAKASIRRAKVILFICVLITFGGISAYHEIGKLEDPAFTIKTAVITALYPGSSAYESEYEVTNRLEDAVQAMGEVKHIRSRSTAGASVIYVDIKDQYTSKELPQIWDKLRQKVNDSLVSMPAGTTVMINNDYGDVYGQYYALVGDGYSMKEVYDYADFLKKNLVLVPGVASVKILGEQTEGIYVEFSASRMSSLGLSPTEVFSVLNQQNTLSEMGNTFAGERYVRISPTSSILNVEDISELVIGTSGGNLTRLKEIATVRRDYINPQSFKMKFNGRPSLAIGIATIEGGNVVKMGEGVTARLKELEAFRPIGIELSEIYMQSDQVTKSVNDFLINLIESLAIVVGVLLIFMGLRAGVIIGAVLLLIIAATLMIMNYYGIFLQVVSLSALIIALGSLVDNSIVVTEGMLVGVTKGESIEESASETVNGSIWAMLGGTIIAIIAFAPIGLSNDSSGEFCRSLLEVVGISMILSWFAALIIAPVFGKLLLRQSSSANASDPYKSPLFRFYRAFLELCLRYRILTCIATVGAFIISMYLLTRIDTTFFPDSETVYFCADIYTQEGTSLNTQEAVTKKIADYVRSFPEVKNVSEFIGGGGLRFMLTYSPPDNDNSFSQLMVELHTAEETRKILLKTQEYIDQSPEIDGICKLFARGSSMAEKIGVRFYGDDIATLRRLSSEAIQIMQKEPDMKFMRTDWREPVEVVRPVILKDQLQSLGLTRPAVNQAILEATSGYAVGAFRDGDKSLQILAAFAPEERNKVSMLHSLPIWAPAANKTVPLGTVFSRLETTFEDNIIIHRDRSRIITAMSEIRLGSNANKILERLMPEIAKMELPLGYSIEWGGEFESSGDAMSGMTGLFIPAVVVIFTIMVFLFNAFKQPIIIFVSLPLIMIGVVAGLSIANMSLSFLAIIGVLSLVGMLAKNSIVLLDEVSNDFEAGRDKYEAIVEDAVGRLRPVSMSALTTVLGMIPLIWDSLFGAMAVTIMAGLTVSTVLTLIIIPVLTAIFFNVKSPD